MGKRSAFDDSDEEEQYPEERPQGTPQQEMGQAPSGQMTWVRAKSSRKRNPSGQTLGHQKRKRGDPKVVEVDPLSFSLPAIHKISSIDELLKEGYEDQGWGAGQFEGILEGHALLMFDPPRVECADLPATGVPRLEDGMRQRYLGSSEFALGINDIMDPVMERGARKARKHFRDMNFAQLPIMQQITGTCPSISKPEDILNILAALPSSFRCRGNTNASEHAAGTRRGAGDSRTCTTSPPRGTTLEAAEEGAPQPTPAPKAETR
ncbi:OLC1v1035597C1 [Oldenlandia corymbosa var. corymbosa]|uniref:OLC1v1035597C1 n=1 Tax=Oldenlandia corymbosa var. corymbosa TaxID=529605 RepID=A0AAV1CU74_OLDCO|nr:OLC1v1035597C1 [Oldenlandia corymbosa var. corymbosa]